MKPKITELYDSLFLVEEKGATCGLAGDDGKQRDIPLAIVGEIIDYAEYDSSEGEYSIGVNFQLMAAQFSPEYLKKALSCSSVSLDEYDDPERKRTISIEMCYQYGGGVPVEVSDPATLAKGLDFEIKRDRRDGHEYLRFKDHEAAKKFLKRVVESRLPVVFSLVGFFLDKSVNAIGSNGWDIIRQQVDNVDFCKRVLDLHH